MRFAALFAVLALPACVSLLPPPPPAPMTFSLRAGEVVRLEGDVKPVVIAVAEPVTPHSAAGSEIVWRRGAEIAVMDRGVWDGAAPDLLQDMLIDTLERRGGVRAVTRQGGGVRADATLQWDVLAFEVVEEGSSLEAVLSVSARLVDMRTRTITHAARHEARVPISSRSGRAAAAAMERAARAATLEIADWAISQAEPAQPSAASTRR